MVLGLWLVLELTSTLPATVFGEYAYFTGIVAFLTPLLCFGIQTVMLKKVSLRAGSGSYVNLFFALCVLLVGVYLLLAYVIAVILSAALSLNISAIMIWACITGTILVEMTHTYYQAIRKSWFSSYFVSGTRQLCFVCVVILTQPTSFDQVVLFYMVTSFLALIPIFPDISHGLGETCRLLIEQRRRLWRVAKVNYFVPGIYFAQVQWGGLVGLPLLLVFLGSTLPPEHLATYAIAAKVAGMSAIVLAPINKVFAPRFVNALEARQEDRIKLVHFTYTLALFAALPFACFFLLGNGMVETFFPADYRNLSLAIGIMGLGQVVNCITGPIVWIVQLAGLEKSLRWMIVCSNLFALAFCWVLVMCFDLGVLAGAIGYFLMLMLPNILALRLAKVNLNLNYGLRIRLFFRDLKAYG